MYNEIMGVFKDTSVQRKSYFRIKCYVVLSLFLFFFIFLLSAFTYLPALHLRSVAILGLSQFNSRDVLQALQESARDSFVGRYFGVDSILTWIFSRPRLPDHIPLASIHIVPNVLSRELTITVTERQRAMIWCVINRPCVWIDHAGVVLGDAPSGEGQLVPTVFDNALSHPFVGRKVITDAARHNLFTILKFLKINNIIATRIELERETLDLRVQSDVGPLLLFNLRNNLNVALPSLEPLRLELDLTNLQYLDFRVPNKIYYR